MEYKSHLLESKIRAFQSGNGIYIENGKYDQEGNEHRKTGGTNPDEGQNDKGGHRNGFDRLET